MVTCWRSGVLCWRSTVLFVLPIIKPIIYRKILFRSVIIYSNMLEEHGYIPEKIGCILNEYDYLLEDCGYLLDDCGNLLEEPI